MITICACPKAFKGHIGIIQENAIRSWKKIDSEIILLGSEEGVYDIVKKYKLRHIPDIKANENNVPYLDDIFRKIQLEAKGEIICYVSADVMLFFKDFKLKTKGAFLGIGYRHDYNLDKLFEFGKDQIQMKDAVLHGASACDYWMFPKGMYVRFPQFTVGRGGQEGWMIWHGKKYGIKVIDFSKHIIAIHQNHDYSHIGKGWWKTKEFVENIKRAGGFWHLRTLRDVDLYLDCGVIKETPLSIYWILFGNPIGQFLLGLKRYLNFQLNELKDIFSQF